MSKRRNKDLEWYAFYQDFNGDELVYINVLGPRLVEDILKGLRSKSEYLRIDDYDSLKRRVKTYLMSRYWCKSEYEVVVSNWTGHDMEQKIDVWYQLEPNLDRICEYIIRELRLNL